MSSVLCLQAARPGLLSVVLFALAHSASVSAGIYKWTDASGVVHYSDRPPASASGGYSDISQNLPTLYGMDAQSLETLERRPASSSKSRSVTNSAEMQAERQQQQCGKYQAQLARIQSQLKSGYNNSRGNRLREQRRTLSEKIYRECRS